MPYKTKQIVRNKRTHLWVVKNIRRGWNVNVLDVKWIKRAKMLTEMAGLINEKARISHKKALSRGGKNKDGVRIESKSANRSRNLKKKKK